jgi:hypothetical protein
MQECKKEQKLHMDEGSSKRTCSLRMKRGVKAPEGDEGETLDLAERALKAAWYLAMCQQGW